MNQELHVVFGAGQVGPRLASRLVARGHRVRVVRRSQRPVELPAVELLSGDAGDADFARDATRGAHVIYHCMNPSAYSGRVWERELPRFGEALVRAAVASDARLVVLDNLYAYGPVDGRRTETTPLGATDRKGKVRIWWSERLEAAAAREGLSYSVGKAGDFFGDGAADQSLISPRAVQGMLRRKRPIAFGDLDALHAFSYVPDVVDALAALGSAEPDVEGKVFHLPVQEVSPRALFAGLGTELGVPEVAPRRVGRLALSLLAFVPLFRELLDTHYQWDRPFLVDDSRFRARFPGVGVTLERAIAETARSARRELEGTGRTRALIADS